MLAEVFAQMRFTASLLFGVSFDVRSLERLVEAMRETRQEFGAIGPEGAELVGAPTLDEATRRDVQLRRFRTQAVRGARETAYYGPLFEQLGLVPARLGYEDIARIPPPTKDAPRTDPDGFVCRTARPGPGSFAVAQDDGGVIGMTSQAQDAGRPASVERSGRGGRSEGPGDPACGMLLGHASSRVAYGAC